MPSIDFVPTVRYAGAVTIFFRDKHTVIVKQGSNNGDISPVVGAT